MKWPAGNLSNHVSQKKSNIRGLCICYLKAIKGQVSLLTLFRTLRVRINSSFFGYFDGTRFKSCERIFTIYFSLFLKMKSSVCLFKCTKLWLSLKVSLVLFSLHKLGMTSHFQGCSCKMQRSYQL